MAFDKSPAHWFGDGYTVDPDGHSVTLVTGSASTNKALPQLTDAGADPATGDIRAVAFAFFEKLYQQWVAQGGPANLPKKMRIARSVSNAPNGDIRYSYSCQFEVAPSGNYALADEP